MRHAWGDKEEATELGAFGLAILLIRDLIPHTVIERSYKGPGFDYWVGDVIEDTTAPFQRRARLEISGILRGSSTLIRSRVMQKVKQTIPSDGADPAYTVVVEFRYRSRIRGSR